ncbi:MAG: hypothetical protein ABSA57_08885 [Candidatus Acidiferrales bacterium]|jgi:outer membrane receptor protein involved in Fe transport
MKHLCAVCGFVLLFVLSASGQTAQAPPAQAPPAEAPPAPPPPPPYVALYEVSGGYSLRSYAESNTVRIGLNGGYGSLEYNILSRLGAAAEVSGGFRNQGLDGDLSIYSVLAGPQIFPFKHRRKVTPFAHVLFGEAFYRNDYPAVGGFPHLVSTDRAFAWEAGGGFDWVHSTRWEIRLLQLDYAPTKFFGNGTKTGYRASIGVIYRFGEKK